jgi:REP element-mobilizing transposase RayT
VPVGDDTLAYQRQLPHLAKDGKTYFVTFCTRGRFVLAPAARDLVLASCIYDHGRLCWMHCVVVMPDHVHLLVTPLECSTLQVVMRRLKGASGWSVNRLLDRRGPLWQRESFDHILRSDEKLREKAEYMLANPVRANLVSDAWHYQWWWRAEV